ncbi:MAG: mechanosensitive ion channel family protein [Sandaracinus sp.]|nr:mechanosensitive ion channel family protein [Myxococcales bacterium]MCB9617023.1 mechanosensitive ion channel family protein [Sandaracinus sp.]MCB9623549.1 mechanosensitive ion channel family protein [Sandaracinus sp.]
MTFSSGVGLVLGVSMVVLLPLVLPKGERRHTKAPLVLLLLHVGIIALRTLVPMETGTADTLRIVAVFFLLASLARSVYLLLLHSVITRYVGGNEVPRIVRDLIQALLYVGVLMATLRAAGVEPTSLLTTSALLTAVIGLSLQDTLGNLFAGLAIQIQHPFRVGDWIVYEADEKNMGKVVEMNWRATKVLTLDEVEITVPNATLAKAALRNYSLPTPRVRRHVYVDAPYDRPPEQVIPELIDAARSVPGVLSSPAPTVIVADFTDRGVRYDVRFHISDLDGRENVAGMVRERLWYALQRLGIEVPVPQRVVRMFDYTEERLAHEQQARVDDRDDALRRVDFLRALPDEARHRLAEGSTTRLYAPSEAVILEGDHGEELFVVRRGEVAVEVGRSRREVARLGPGQFFGEMSLMTGEQRKATVRALRETELLVINKEALARVLKEQPELAETISRVLSERAAALDTKTTMPGTTEGEATERESRVLLTRIKRFFSLGNDD